MKIMTGQQKGEDAIHAWILSVWRCFFGIDTISFLGKYFLFSLYLLLHIDKFSVLVLLILLLNLSYTEQSIPNTICWTKWKLFCISYCIVLAIYILDWHIVIKQCSTYKTGSLYYYYIISFMMKNTKGRLATCANSLQLQFT